MSVLLEQKFHQCKVKWSRDTRDQYTALPLVTVLVT